MAPRCSWIHARSTLPSISLGTCAFSSRPLRSTTKRTACGIEIRFGMHDPCGSGRHQRPPSRLVEILRCGPVEDQLANVLNTLVDVGRALCYPTSNLFVLHKCGGALKVDGDSEELVDEATSQFFDDVIPRVRSLLGQRAANQSRPPLCRNAVWWTLSGFATSVRRFALELPRPDRTASALDATNTILHRKFERGFSDKGRPSSGSAANVCGRRAHRR